MVFIDPEYITSRDVSTHKECNKILQICKMQVYQTGLAESFS